MAQNNTQYTSTHDCLCNIGYVPEQPLMSRKVVTVSELKAKYTLNITQQKQSTVYAIDGYMVKTGAKCDKLVLVDITQDTANPLWAEIFVELKGTDVPHAIEQLRQTIAKPIFKHPTNKTIRARIVAQSFPSNKSNPIMEKAKIEFKKKFNCELKGFKTGQADSI